MTTLPAMREHVSKLMYAYIGGYAAIARTCLKILTGSYQRPGGGCGRWKRKAKRNEHHPLPDPH
jgi:hypothetical protein